MTAWDCRYVIGLRDVCDTRRPRDIIEQVNETRHPRTFGSLAYASNPIPGLNREIDIEIELPSGIVVVSMTTVEAKILAYAFPDLEVTRETFLELADTWFHGEDFGHGPEVPDSWTVDFEVIDPAGEPVSEVKIVAKLRGVDAKIARLTDKAGRASLSVPRDDTHFVAMPIHGFWDFDLGPLSLRRRMTRNRLTLNRLILDSGFQWDVRMSGVGDLESKTPIQPVRIGLIDSGVAEHHNLRKPEKWHDMVSGERRKRSAHDPRGHGTSIAGIIAGQHVAEGVHGYVPNAHLYVYRAVPALGGASDIDTAIAIHQAVEDGVEIICLPLVAPDRDERPSATLGALRFAGKKGVVCILPAGNDGGPLSWPAACKYSNCIAVGAFGRIDTFPNTSTHARAVQDYPASGGYFLATFSNGGEDPGSAVDVLAPGVACITTVPGGYGAVSGTSYAAAHVVGMMAALLERLPSARQYNLEDRAEHIKRSFLSLARKFGWGRGYEGLGRATLNG